MKLLVVVADSTEVEPMRRLLAKAGIRDYQLAQCCHKVEGKPTMKEIRMLKPPMDDTVKTGDYDYIMAAGETAARLVLDTSAVNISRLRGRDFEYVEGVKHAGKKAKTVLQEVPEGC